MQENIKTAEKIVNPTTQKKLPWEMPILYDLDVNKTETGASNAPETAGSTVSAPSTSTSAS